MFQYAAGLSLSYLRQTTLKTDVTWFSDTKTKSTHERYGLDCFNTANQFATVQEINYYRGLQRNVAEDRFYRTLKYLGLKRYADLLPVGGNWYIQKHFHFDPAFHHIPDGSLIDGGFQSEKFFNPVSHLVRKHFSFRYPPTSEVSRMGDHIQNTNSVAIHFRRRDFVSDPIYKEKISTVGSVYYQNAINYLKSHLENAVYYIFSDDIDYVKQSFKLPEASIYVDCVNDWNSYDAMRLMSLCKHFIIANSTFSWWGAWLSESPQKIVTYPDPWFANMPQHNVKDLCPASWHAIHRYNPNSM